MFVFGIILLGSELETAQITTRGSHDEVANSENPWELFEMEESLNEQIASQEGTRSETSRPNHRKQRTGR